jgi:hypothetical protein
VLVAALPAATVRVLECFSSDDNRSSSSSSRSDGGVQLEHQQLNSISRQQQLQKK